MQRPKLAKTFPVDIYFRQKHYTSLVIISGAGSMKYLLDLDRLLEEKKISAEEHQRLIRCAMQDTGSLAFNILVSFGVIAVSGASIVSVPSPITAMILGVVIGIIGLSPLRQIEKWQLFAQICALIGSLLLCGGILWQFAGETSAWILVTILFATVGIILRHGLLIVLAVLSLSCTLGSETMYYHASYFLLIEQPTITILTFGIISILTYLGSSRLPLDYERLAIIASRTSLFLVNLGFWIGSLWGDEFRNGTHISEIAFTVLWAILLIGVGVWAVFANRRWALNICAIFAAIHFYTQWFEHLGAQPSTVLLAGILALLFAIGLRQLNSILFKQGS
jgi:iron complex transport system permease protein